MGDVALAGVHLEHAVHQLRPLYLSLHAYVRGQLAKKYGKDVVPPNGPIPAHLLGNIWAQEWNNVYDLMNSPKPPQTYDLTKILQDRKTDPKGMAKYAENFFVSLGFPPLPPTFWERSLFTKPADRDVVCHASAWDVDSKDDLRVKMCIQITEEDFRTIHHEEGHNFYQRAYNTQPPLFQGSANDGFHEAVGDTIALSVTPEYLKKIGLIFARIARYHAGFAICTYPINQNPPAYLAVGFRCLWSLGFALGSRNYC